MNEICKAEQNIRSERSEVEFEHPLPKYLERGYTRIWDAGGTRPIKKC